MNYIALQVKTSYSILSSLNDIKKLVSRANDYGYRALAITDNANMFGVMEFYQECQKLNIKPIIGMELHISEYVVLLYAKNNIGYKNLIKLATIVSEREIDIEDLIKYKDDLILVMPSDKYSEEIYKTYDDGFIGYHDKTERDKYEGRKVFINDVSYLDINDDVYLDYLKMIGDGKVIGEYAFHEEMGKHLLKEEEVLELSYEEDIQNTQYISDNCNVDLGYTPNLLPIYDMEINSRDYLSKLAYKGLNKRLKDDVPEIYKTRLEKELNVIDKMGFNDYFLIVYDYVLYAKKHDILVGPGRGSAAGSLVSYTLGITDIDPIKYDLLFERFLNDERVTMPDIDIDFDALKRQEVIDYVISKYGEKKVVGIITFNTLGAKQVIRDVGRVLKLNQSLIDNVAKMCNGTLLATYQINDALRKLIANSEEVKKLYEIALHLEGLPRHISVHAAGVVMSNQDIDETIPLYRNQLGMYVSGYSKDYLEPLGLLKMDFLGISNLTLIDEVIDNTKNDKQINITFNNIPENDPKTIELFKRGDTDGIFQFESPGMIKFLKKLKANSFNDIVLAIALYRPGPMESIPEYLRRRTGLVKIDYLHQDLEDILKETYGIIIYQEQIMQIACKMAGYTLGEADILRRAMSKKKESIMLSEREKFVKRSVALGYNKETVEEVYDLILKFANYGFNKSHAVAYSMIAYKMAFLKVHFYRYFMISLLNNAINNEHKTSNYIAMLRRQNVKVLKPDINYSEDKYIIKNGEIICPLSIIRNVGSNITNMILREREKGLFTNLIDFTKRMYSQSVNRKVLESLIKASCFDKIDSNKKTLINNLDNIVNYVELSQDNGLIEVPEPIIDEFDDYNKQEKIYQEFEILGFYLSEHPVSRYKKQADYSTLRIPDLVNKYVELVLEVNKIKEVITKKNDVMAFVSASDEYDSIDLTLFPKIYDEFKNMAIHDIVRVYGRVEKRLDNYQIVVSKIKNMTKEK